MLLCSVPNAGKSVLLEQAKPLLGKVVSHILTNQSGRYDRCHLQFCHTFSYFQELYSFSQFLPVDHYTKTLLRSVRDGVGKLATIVLQ